MELCLIRTLVKQLGLCLHYWFHILSICLIQYYYRYIFLCGHL